MPRWMINFQTYYRKRSDRRYRADADGRWDQIFESAPDADDIWWAMIQAWYGSGWSSSRTRFCWDRTWTHHRPCTYVYAWDGYCWSLTREGEIAIAKRIEEGIRDVRRWPPVGTVQFVLDEYRGSRGEKTLWCDYWLLDPEIEEDVRS